MSRHKVKAPLRRRVSKACLSLVSRLSSSFVILMLILTIFTEISIPLKIYQQTSGLSGAKTNGQIFDWRIVRCIVVLNIHVIDVGDGNAVLIEAGSKTLLYDAGRDGQGLYKVLPYLAKLGIDGRNRKLDYTVVSHYHDDHIGGYDEVIYGLDREPNTADDLGPTIAAYDRGELYWTTYYNDYVRAAGGKRATVTDGMKIDMGNGVIVKVVAVNGNRVLQPPFRDSYYGTDYNEDDFSIALLVQYGAFSYLIAGDLHGEANSEYHYHDIETSLAYELMELAPITVYQANDHGGEYSSSQYFIDTIRPTSSIISTGQNPLGHPYPTIVSRLESASPGQVYETRFKGNIVIEVSSDSQFVFKFPTMQTNEVYLYFDASVDTSYVIPGGIPANGNVNIREKFLNRVNNAKYAIDVAMPHLRRDFVGDEPIDALIAAHNRGVRVRVIVDYGFWSDYNTQKLVNNGIPVLHDTTLDPQYDMHNKFAIFDYGDGDFTDDWVWNSSMHRLPVSNPEWASAYIEVQSSELAKAFTEEFKLMWGDGPGQGGEPGPNSLFHEAKEGHDISQHQFVINGRLWEYYPSPLRGAARTNVKLINMTYPKLKDYTPNPFGYGEAYIGNANFEMFFSNATFTYAGDYWGDWSGGLDVMHSLRWMWYKNKIDVRGLFGNWTDEYCARHAMLGDPERVIRNNHPSYEYYIWSPPLPAGKLYSNTYPYAHQEYGIIDGFHMNSTPSVLFGSRRWTNDSDTHNDESTLYIWDPIIVNQFIQEFAKRYAAAGGTLPHPAPSLTQVTPAEGFEETETPITLTGEKFEIGPLLAVQIGTTYCTVDLANSTPTSIKATVPAGMKPGLYDVTVTNPSGWQATLKSAFRIRENPLKYMACRKIGVGRQIT